MSKLPSRGPRVMHGMGRLVQQAKNLAGLANGPARAPIGAPRPELSATEAEAQAALAALVQRLELAEKRLSGVTRALDSFDAQVGKLPPDNEIANSIRAMLRTIRQMTEGV